MAMDKVTPLPNMDGAWMDWLRSMTAGLDVSVDVSTGDDDYDAPIFARVYDIQLDGNGKPILLAIEISHRGKGDEHSGPTSTS